MNHVTLFSLATLCLALAGAAAQACVYHDVDWSKPTAQLAAMAQEQVGADIKTFQFQPKAIEVKAGTTVTWTNRDAIEHSVTAGAPGAPSGDFDSGFFTQGRSFSVTFDKPGAYTYFCARHNSMRGTVTVVE